MRIFFRAFIVVFLLAVVSASAVDNNILVQDLSLNSYITNWLVAGPLPNLNDTNSIRQGFFYDYLAAIGGESNAVIHSGMPVPGRESIVFTNFISKLDFINLDSIFKMPDNSVAYAFTFIEVESATTAYLHAGSDDGISVWLDNKNIIKNYIERGYIPDEDWTFVKLTEGRHRLLVKIEDRFGAWKFSLRFTDKKTHEKIIATNIKDYLNINLFSPTAEWEQVSLSFDTIPAITSINIKIEGQWLDITGGKTQLFSSLPGVPVQMPEAFSTLPECSLNARAIGLSGKTPSSFFNLYFSPLDSLITNREAKINSLLEGLSTNPSTVKIASRHKGILNFLLSQIGKVQNSKKSSISHHLILTKLDKIIENLDNGIDYFGALKGDFLSAYISSADNSPQPFQVSIPETYNSEVPIPLVVFLHDYGEPFSTYKSPSANFSYISVRVHSCGKSVPYFGLAMHDVISVINYMSLNYNIDPERVYLIGTGMGGNGVWEIASSFPHLFAAVSALNSYSANLPLKNLYNLPSLVIHGELDLVRPVQLSKAAVNSLIKYACPVVFHELKNVGYQLMQAAKSIDPVEWLLDHRREQEPRDLILECRPSSLFKSYWMSVLSKLDPHKPTEAKARFVGVNNLVLSLSNIEHAAISLPEKIVEPDSLMQFMVNGNYKELSAPLPEKVYVSCVNGSYTVSRDNPITKRERRQYSAGSWQNFFDGEPVMIVKGTSGADDVRSEIEACAKRIQRWSFVDRKSSSVNFKIKSDTEIDEDDLLKYNLILLGGPKENSFVNKIKKGLITPFKNNSINIGTTNLSLAGKGLWLTQYNPKSENRLVWIWASSEPGFFKANAAWMAEWSYPAQNPPDMLLVNLNPSSYEKVLLFDKNWKVIQKYLNNKKVGNAPTAKILAKTLLESSGSDYAWLPQKPLPGISRLNSSEAANIVFKNSEFMICEIYSDGMTELLKQYSNSVYSVPETQLNAKTVYSIAVMPRDLKSLAEAAKGKLGDACYIQAPLQETFKKILSKK